MANDNDPLLDEFSPEEKDKAQIDDALAKEPSARAMEKVDLDLDDAPFLEDEAPPEPVVEDRPVQAPEETGSPKPPRRKLRLPWRPLAGGGLSLLLTGIVVILILLRTTGPESSSPVPSEANATNQTEAHNGTASAMVETLTLAFDPFTVEYLQDGGLRFLTLKFSVKGRGEDLNGEVQGKMTLLRDAVYQHLKNKDLVLMSGPDHAGILKTELLDVLNRSLSHGSFSELFIEAYTVS